MKPIVNALGKLNRGKRAYAVFVLCATTPIALSAQTVTTLASFNGTDGAGPSAALIQATDGNLYGTAYVGGANYYGTVFKITPSGTLTTLYSFCSRTNCTDGGNPSAALVQAANGDFYGTTYEGGVHCNAFGCGTVFKITPSGTLTTIYSFCPQSGCPDGEGEHPEARLVQATNGDFYGTTAFGGAHRRGTVFKITPSGTLMTLYNFCPRSGCPDGLHPYAELVQAANGDLYGTTSEGGANGLGTVFKITPSGTLTTLYSFCSQGFPCTDGYGPSGLVQATNGDFYGTTGLGGANNDGTVFEITPSGTLTTLYSFCSQSGCPDGQSPNAGLVQATNGDLYGTTLNGGGANNDGTVFSLSVGLGPFVETRPRSGEVGTVVEILGTDLTGATSVSFNGTAATFTVNLSGSAISTTVPALATTGTVEVVTPSRTLSSNVPFRVLP